MDYTEIFNDEAIRLAEAKLIATELMSEEEQLIIIKELKDRERLMESAIEELRIRRHSVIKGREDAEALLPMHKLKEIQEADAIWRQKKQMEKLDKAAALRKAQISSFESTLRDAGWTSEEIRMALQKKGYL